jgi:hypothetical protein
VEREGVKVVEGDFLSAIGRKGAPRLLLAAGNGVVKRDGSLVMGAGSARALAEAYPQAPRVLGEMARREGRLEEGGWYLYGLLAVRVSSDLAIGLFQTKGDWRERASLSLIAYSAKRLAEWLEENPGWEAHMAFPGVGLGGLEEREVLEALRERLLGLPVVLYRLWARTSGAPDSSLEEEV